MLRRVSLIGSWLLLTLFAAAANANIVYNVNRTIGAGSVTGFVETDGTLGVLTVNNIVHFTLTLAAPNIHDGPVHVIDMADPNTSPMVQGSALTATATQLLFDFDAGGSNFLLYGRSTGRMLGGALKPMAVLATVFPERLSGETLSPVDTRSCVRQPAPA